MSDLEKLQSPPPKPGEKDKVPREGMAQRTEGHLPEKWQEAMDDNEKYGYKFADFHSKR